MPPHTDQPTSLSPPARWAAVLLLGILGFIGVSQGILNPTPSALRAATTGSVSASDSTLMAPPATATAAPAANTRSPTAASPSRRININTATAAELDLLPGIGPALAGRIIDHRTAHGRFATLDDLDAVKGIGPKTIAKLAPYAAAE